jgi:hypothetical protein
LLGALAKWSTLKIITKNRANVVRREGITSPKARNMYKKKKKRKKGKILISDYPKHSLIFHLRTRTAFLEMDMQNQSVKVSGLHRASSADSARVKRPVKCLTRVRTCFIERFHLSILRKAVDFLRRKIRPPEGLHQH